MHEYSITFAGEVDLAATAIERRAADSTVRRNALLWRVRAIPEMRKACFRLEPVSALVDAWIFARQVDQLFNDGADILPPEGLASMQGDLHMSAAAADRLASTAEGIPTLALNERRIVLDEMNRQRALVMEAISVERERAVGEIVRAFAEERSELLRNVESQRLATLEWATAERREAIAEVLRELAGSMEVLRSERAVVVDDLRHIVDVVLLRVGIFLITAVVLAPLVAHAYARVWPRRWREPQR
jgi:hypothetical protein